MYILHIIIVDHVFLLWDVCVGKNLATGEDKQCFIELNTCVASHRGTDTGE